MTVPGVANAARGPLAASTSGGVENVVSGDSPAGVDSRLDLRRSDTSAGGVE